MKVLFISSGNAKEGLSPIIKNQGESLTKKGVDIRYFTINGKGFVSYLKHIRILYKQIRGDKYDVYHAHFSLSGFVATLAGCRPLVVSLMGSEIYSGIIMKTLIRLFAHLRWDEIIVKSLSMKRDIRINKAQIIPNGVDLDVVKPSMPQQVNSTQKTILFAANPVKNVKNYQLAEKAVSKVEKFQVKLNIIYSVSHTDVIKAINNADVLLVTSLWEGSPNIVKEAMACNCPIATTDVGDVKWVLGNTAGCYITTYDPKDVAKKITAALDFGKSTNGRQRIIELELDSEKIAAKIIRIYENVLNSQLESK